MFAIVTTPLDVDKLKRELYDDQAGALVTFEGWVRCHNEGKDVIALEYEAYEELAGEEGAKILEELRTGFDILGASCVHRVGRLEIGDLAVWIGVTAAHRAEAFQACQQVINEVKARLPIWKKEYYSDGDSGWVNCQCHGADAAPPNPPPAGAAR